MKTTYICTFFCLAYILTACEFTDGNIDGKSVKEEIKQRKIQRLTEGEILEKAIEAGREIKTETQEALIQQLQNAITKGGKAYAMEFCNIHAIKITDSLSQRYGAVVRRVSHKPRNPEDAADSTEAMYLDGYLYNIEQGVELKENVQFLRASGEILYTAPITLASPLCLSCHGNPEKDIDAATLSKIKELYPEDQAVGFSQGDFRGMWSIRLSQKKLIIAMQPEKKKK